MTGLCCHVYLSNHYFVTKAICGSLVPRPEQAEEEKWPGFCSYLSTCMHGTGRKKRFRCHMVSSLTSIVHSKLKQRAYLCASITMSAINASHLRQASVKSKNSVALFNTTGIQHTGSIW